MFRADISCCVTLTWLPLQMMASCTAVAVYYEAQGWAELLTQIYSSFLVQSQKAANLFSGALITTHTGLNAKVVGYTLGNSLDGMMAPAGLIVSLTISVIRGLFFDET